MQYHSGKMIFFSVMIGFLPCNNTLSASPQSEPLIAFALSEGVKNYPMKVQEIDTLFEAKCLKCHGVKETVRSPGVLPTNWEQTVEKMRVMPKAEFSQEEGERIIQFLIYDSYTRRRSELKNQLKALPKEQLEIESEKLDKVINQFKE
jgi:hypothetical protein